MSYLSTFMLRVEAFLRSGHFTPKNTCLWNRIISYTPSITHVKREFGARSYSTKSAESVEPSKPIRSKKKAKPETATKKESKKDKEDEAFYVVRRGDVIGFYRSLDDCQAQVGSSICDSPISLFKGQHLPKNTEEHLGARGLKNAIYSINAGDMKDGLFGTLVQCSLLDPTSSEDSSKTGSHLGAGLQSVETLSSISTSTDLSQKHAQLSHPEILNSTNYKSCILKFDGSSKGNPGKAGAGAVLLATDGSLICTLREGCGLATSNEAEYRALRLGLKFALEKGFNRISVQGDSKLVCMQVLGLWKIKSNKLAGFLEEVRNFRKQFLSFQMFHVLRALNSDADCVANRAVTLYNGEIVEETPD